MLASVFSIALAATAFAKTIPKIGIELEAGLFVHPESILLPFTFKKGAVLIESDGYNFTLDEANNEVHGFNFDMEFVTRPFRFDEDSALVETLKEIREDLCILYSKLVRFDGKQKFTPQFFRSPSPNYYHYHQFNQDMKNFAGSSVYLNQAVRLLPLDSGIFLQYFAGTASVYPQITVGFHPKTFFSILKKAMETKIFGRSFQQLPILKVAESAKAIEDLKITNPFMQSFLFLIHGYIHASRHCAANNLFAGRVKPNPLLYAKQFTNDIGILARTSFADMFRSLPKYVQKDLQKNLLGYVKKMFESCDSNILEREMFLNGYTVTNLTERQHNERFVTREDGKHVSYGPIIKDWLNGFLFKGIDLLKGPEYESMGSYKMDGDLWLIELRQMPFHMMALPNLQHAGIDQARDEYPISIYGFRNLYTLVHLFHWFNTKSYRQLLEMDIEEANMLTATAFAASAIIFGDREKELYQILESRIDTSAFDLRSFLNMYTRELL